MLNDVEWDEYKQRYLDSRADIKLFMDGVERFFIEHPSLFVRDEPVIHTTKRRLKGLENLRKKIDRKILEGREISPANFLSEITDLSGVRIIHLFQNDYSVIDAAIRRKIEGGDWVCAEQPKAFTWDPEVTDFFKKFDLQVEQRETFYTSVHFLLKPRADSHICCEVQVRTLFEEIWGEVDHKINYPVQCESLTCREQLMVLSKIVGAGSRLVDSIRRSLEEDEIRRASEPQELST